MRCPDVSGGVSPSGLTVNQPSYDFEGSSPSSPTSLRSLRELRLGKPHRSEGCRGVARRAKPGSLGKSVISEPNGRSPTCRRDQAAGKRPP